MKKVKHLLSALLLLTTVSTQAQVAIGIATPATSAQLDVTSTNKGILIPRMASTSAVVAPAEGLLIYQTNAPVGFYVFKGGVWTIISTGTLNLTTTGTSGAATLVGNTINIPQYTGGSTTHTIGENYGGGIVFYITPDGLHGLIAETIDQGISNWYYAQNIISTASNHSTLGRNFTDWRLPTSNELNLLYVQRVVVGGFNNGAYWSSSEADNLNALFQYFHNGFPDYNGKNFSYYVRAVRVF